MPSLTDFFRFQVHAQVAELVDALDSKSSTARCAGSIPALGTKTRVRNKARATFRTLVFFFALIFFLALLLILILSLYYLCINMYLIRQFESYKRSEKQSENDVWSSVFFCSHFLLLSFIHESHSKTPFTHQINFASAK